MEPEVKPGWATTEFWTTTVGSVVLAVFGVIAAVAKISPEDQTALTEAITKALTSIAAIAGVAWMIWSYVRGRTAVKVEALKAQAAVQTVVAAQKLGLK